MAWGDSTNIVTTNLDAASGVAPLDASSKILATYLPNELNSTSGTALTLDPATGKVNIEEVVNLAPQTLAQLNARTDKAEGDIAYCSNGNAGSKTVAVYDGSNWKVVALGATIS